MLHVVQISYKALALSPPSRAAQKCCCGRAEAVGTPSHGNFAKESVLISLWSMCRTPPPPSGKLLVLQGACGHVHGFCAVQGCLGKAHWAEAGGHTAKWTREFGSGSDVKHKCAYQALSSCFGGWLCGMTLVRLWCKPTLCHCLVFRYFDNL